MCQLMKRAACNLTELTAQVVAGFVSHNTVAVGELPHLIKVIHDALLAVKTAVSTPLPRIPAVPVGESVTRDYIVCLDDGQRLKMLKRHIRRKYSLSPEAYRARWQLPPDYPMVAPGYAELRSSLAKRGAGKR
ncbi:MAG: Transcriptional regulator [Gammaproteobacteria bacterium]|nr:Transcriptional regulator [Gammaproteobacteria bacterium]